MALKLNLGAGRTREPGYTSVDVVSAFEPDVVLNLEIIPWPWSDNSVSEIRMFHVLEHLGPNPDAFLNIMEELYRILEPDGILHIKVPHVRCDNQWGNYTHIRPITYQLLGQFSKRENCMPELHAESPVDFEIVEATNHCTPRWHQKRVLGLITEQQLMTAAEELWNVVAEVEFKLRKVAHA